MKIYVSHKKISNFEKELYEPLRESDLADKHEFILPHANNQQFDSKYVLLGKKCDLVVAEVSYPATGQGIELGWAYLKNIPIICIYKKGADIAGSLKSITDNFIEYENREDMIDKLSEGIEEKTKN